MAQLLLCVPSWQLPLYRLALSVQRLDGVAEAQDHDVVQQGAVELDVQHPVGADEVVDRSEGLPPGVFPGGVPVVDAVEEEDVVAALSLSREKLSALSSR